MLIGTRSSSRFGFALGALVALGGLASAQIGVKPPAGAIKPTSVLVSPTPTRTPTQTPTPEPFTPLRIVTDRLVFVALAVTPAPTFAPVRITTGRLSFTALAVTPTPTFVPVRIRTGALRFEAR